MAQFLTNCRPFSRDLHLDSLRVVGSLFKSFKSIGLTRRIIVRQREGLRVWFGTHSREEMEGESKRNIRRIALISKAFSSNKKGV